MPKEIISSKQATFIIVVFLFGSSVVMGINSELFQDTWIALIFSLLIVIPLFMIYARIIKLCPGKDIYTIMEELFGKIVSKILIIPIIWYAIHLGALVLKNFSEFIKVVSMNSTPEIVLMLAMIIVVIYLSKSGIEVLGRWAFIIFFIITGVVIFTLLASISKMDFNKLLPVFEHNILDISKTSYNLLTFPFAESVLFLTIANSLKKKDSPYKIYIYSALISIVIFLIVIIRNIALLGAPLNSASYFPSYMAARLIQIGDFFTRIEGVITVNFIFAGITKITVCLIAASKGISHLFKINDYKLLVTPTGFLILALSSILYTNISEMFAFLPVYAIYAIPFQIIIPVLIWIVAEVKHKKMTT